MPRRVNTIFIFQSVKLNLLESTFKNILKAHPMGPQSMPLRKQPSPNSETIFFNFSPDVCLYQNPLWSHFLTICTLQYVLHTLHLKKFLEFYTTIKFLFKVSHTVFGSLAKIGLIILFFELLVRVTKVIMRLREI